jgi:ABC-2 type transport system permease protein
VSASFLTVVLAAWLKDLQIAGRYLPNLVGRLLDVGIRVLFFLLLSQLIQVKAESSPLGMAISGIDLMIFFQGALILLVFNTTALNAPVETVDRDLYNGTLEYLFSNAISRYAYFLGTVLASATVNVMIAAPLFALLVAYAEPNMGRMLLMLAVCALVLLANVAVGVLMASLALLWRQVGSLVVVLGILSEMLAGAYLPVTALPYWLQYVALVLPQTWGFDLIRAYSFGGRWQTLYPIWLEWLILAGSAALYTAAAVLLLRRAERLAKRSGLNLI